MYPRFSLDPDELIDGDLSGRNASPAWASQFRVDMEHEGAEEISLSCLLSS